MYWQGQILSLKALKEYRFHVFLLASDIVGNFSVLDLQAYYSNLCLHHHMIFLLSQHQWMR